MEVEKDATLDELKRKITDKYFPFGRNVIQNVLLHELDTFLATFTGQKLPERLDNGKIFTFGEFIEQYNSSQVRIYLHTELKSEV